MFDFWRKSKDVKRDYDQDCDEGHHKKSKRQELDEFERELLRGWCSKKHSGEEDKK